MPDQDARMTGLILSGGGARAAYQVGVLSALSGLLRRPDYNPFPVIVGTSAGAINAVGLGCGALDFSGAVHRLTQVWQGFRTADVYRSDLPGVTRQAWRFMWHSALGVGRRVPVALLDNQPLRELLAREMDFSGIAAAVRQNALHALAVTSFGYASAQSVTFYQGQTHIAPWFRQRRMGVPTRLSLEHLLASSAIPLLFPAVRLHQEYFGDGAVRQHAPISPALHLGARRVLVIGVSDNPGKIPAGMALQDRRTPSLAQIGIHLLNSTFIDNLETDIELLERLNRLGLVVPPEQRRRLGVEPVEVLVISPSKPLDAIAARHRRALPRALRLFLRGPGATQDSGAGVLSYLLFEADYCQELIELGYQDAMAKRAELMHFLGEENVRRV